MFPRCTQDPNESQAQSAMPRSNDGRTKIWRKTHQSGKKHMRFAASIDTECNINYINSKYSHIYSYCVSLCVANTTVFSMVFSLIRILFRGIFPSVEFIQFTELWALLQIEIYRMPGSKWGFESQEPRWIFWDFGPWMVMIKEQKGKQQPTTNNHNNHNNNNNNNQQPTTTNNQQPTTTTTTTFDMTSWNMVESVKKQACLLTARLHSTYLSKSIGFANGLFWIRSRVLQTGLCHQRISQLTTSQSICPLTRHSKGCWTPPLKHDWLNIGKTHTHTTLTYICNRTRTSPFGMTKWILWPLKGLLGVKCLSQVSLKNHTNKT